MRGLQSTEDNSSGQKNLPEWQVFLSMKRGLSIVYVHRDFKTESDVFELRLGPHYSVLVWC